MLPNEIEKRIRNRGSVNRPLFKFDTDIDAAVQWLSGGTTDRVDHELARLKTALEVYSVNPSGDHYVIIDEVDCVSREKFQPALKAFISDQSHAMFILTTNHIDKLDPGMRNQLGDPCALFRTSNVYNGIVRMSFLVEREFWVRKQHPCVAAST